MSGFHEMIANGAIQQPHSNHAVNVASAGGGGMLPFEGKGLENVVNADINSTIALEGADSLFSKMNAGGGALGGTLNQLGEQALDYLGTPHAKGDNLKLEELGDKIKVPNVPGDLGEGAMKNVGLVGAGGGASH